MLHYNFKMQRDWQKLNCKEYDVHGGLTIQTFLVQSIEML